MTPLLTWSVAVEQRQGNIAAYTFSGAPAGSRAVVVHTAWLGGGVDAGKAPDVREQCAGLVVRQARLTSYAAA